MLLKHKLNALIQNVHSMLLRNPLFPFKFFLNYSKNVGRSYKELSYFNRHDSIMSYSDSYKSTVLYKRKYRKNFYYKPFLVIISTSITMNDATQN